MEIRDKFRQSIEKGHFAVSVELSVPYGAGPDELLKHARVLQDAADGFLLSDMGQAWVNMSPLVTAGKLLAHGLEPVVRLNCRDRNRLALHSDLLGLNTLGVRTLVLDKGTQLSQPGLLNARPVFDLSCVELIKLALGIGSDDQQSATRFLAGTGATTFVPGTDWSGDMLFSRAAAGASFLVTQPCFSVDVLKAWLQRLVELKLTWKFAVVVTLAPLPSAETARWLQLHSRGVAIPQELLASLDSAPDPEQAGIDHCIELVREVREMPGVSGINMLTLGNPHAAAAVLQAATGSRHQME